MSLIWKDHKYHKYHKYHKIIGLLYYCLDNVKLSLTRYSFDPEKIKLNFKKKWLKEKDMVNKMCDIGVIPDNTVFYPGKDNEHKLIRNENTSYLKDKGKDGFEVELFDLLYWDEFDGYAAVIFDSFEDFLSLMDVNSVLHFLYCEKCNLRSFLRNNEISFYRELKNLEKFVDQCEMIQEYGKEGYVIFAFFEGTKKILKEYEKGFNHKNKKLEKLFNKLAKKF